MFWIVFLLLNFVSSSDDSMEKFKSCNNEKCILIQCYFPVSEFLNATQNEIKPFENYIEQNHLFINYHLCNDLSADNMDEVGACIYGVLFKLYQFDANLTIHQRIHVQQAGVLEEAVAVVIDMISKILYRVQAIDDGNEIKELILKSKEEDIVVIDAQSLTSQVHLDVSRTILNYGQWFTFIYSIALDNEKSNCLYRVHPIGSDIITPKCANENDVRMVLEQRIGTKKIRSNVVRVFYDLTHINVFQRTLSTLFYIHKNSMVNLISNKNIVQVPVNILNFQTIEIENHVFLHGPYPFYLFWSANKNVFQRLGDQPSDELIDTLLHEEQDLKNMYGMFDDEVRHIADTYTEFEINPNILFLKTAEDYHHLRQKYPKSAILFTVRWDSTSKLARKTFHQLASHLINYLPMIDVDCFDWTDICNAENIVQWPTLILTENETMTKVYQGSTNEDEIALTLFRFSVNQPYRIENDSHETSIENLLIRQPVIILARIQHEEKFLYDTYKNLVDMFLDNEHIFFMFQYSTKSSSLIIKQKYGDVNSSFQPKTTVHKLTEDLDHLQILIIDALRIPLVPFDPIDFIKSTPTTFIAASRSQLTQLNSYFFSNDNSLIWIDTNSPWVVTINQYGHISYPAVIYIDYLHGHVYVNSNLNDIPTWLEKVLTQSITPFYIMSSSEIDEGPSQKEFDFNKQIIDEQWLNEHQMIHEESEKINEHGLGFDMNGLPIEMNS